MDKIGRYSEALDAQLKLLEFFSSPEVLAGAEALRAERGWNVSVAQLVLPPLLRGETFYWSEPICELIANAALSIPGTWTLREESLEVLHGFAWLAKPIKIKSSEKLVQAIGWFPLRRQGENGQEVWPINERPVLTDSERDFLALVFFSESTEAPVPFPHTIGYWPINEPLSEVRTHLLEQVRARHPDMVGVTIHEKLSLFATMVAFLEQRILVAPRFLADRMTRRRFERVKQKPLSDKIRPIALRRIERRTGEGEHRHVDWKCRWPVSGHWRNQWYPSKQHYRPKYIASYLKGPEDKPLRNPGRLFAVIR